ncbi:MAG TPA: HPr family phosphocarrier protein [Pyrinomonadaceae bacterium]|nr:HPr family phosphocarrier protein [Pyrinomonadaceae bacterium]
MVERQVTLVNRLGLHARAAAKLVRLASEHSSDIRLYNSKADKYADARSILDLLTLGASFGVTLTVSVEGEDEVAAIDAVSHLFADGFGELE